MLEDCIMEYSKLAAQSYMDTVNAKHANGEWKHLRASILRDMEYAFAYLITREADAFKLRQEWYTQVGLSAMAQRHGCMSGVTVQMYSVEVDLHDAVYSAPKHYASIYKDGNFIGAVDNVQQLLAWLLATHW
mgnify:CR=1 FL=1